jgi:hypothetical protein
MKIDNLRSLIRESINEYISEINAAGDRAACEAKITATQEAIAKRQKLMAKEGLDEDYHSMLDENKMKELKKDIAALERNLTKLQKQLDKLNTKSEPKAEVVADAKIEEEADDTMTEEAPIDVTDVMAEMDVEETAINESFLKMQKLAGVITETQYNEKKRLIENQLNENEIGGIDVEDVKKFASDPNVKKISQQLKSDPELLKKAVKFVADHAGEKTPLAEEESKWKEKLKVILGTAGMGAVAGSLFGAMMNPGLPDPSMNMIVSALTMAIAAVGLAALGTSGTFGVDENETSSLEDKIKQILAVGEKL